MMRTDKLNPELLSELKASYERIRDLVHKTPVLRSSLLDNYCSCELFFKCENFQKMGAFKIRGATNAILKLSEEERRSGVVTHSSGNMAQAVALAAKQLDIPAYIVMPNNAPSVKKEAVRDYGGIITECEATIEAREREANRIVRETGASFLHPSNDLHVIMGQGTSAYELLLEYPDLDYVITPVGGGGLLAGTVIALQAASSEAKVLAGEPLAVDDAYRSLISGTIELNSSSDTIADGLRTHLGDVNFPIIQNGVERIIRVEEDEIKRSMRLMMERMKIVVEPSSAVTLAAIIKEKEQFKGKKIGLILSGGNIDLANYFDHL